MLFRSIAVGAFLRLRLPGEREAWPIATAGAMAYAVLPSFGGVDATYEAYQVVAVTSIALLIGMLPHMVASRLPSLDLAARQVLTTALAAGLFRPLLWLARENSLSPWRIAVVMTAVVVVALAADAALAAVVRSARTRAPFAQCLTDELAAGLGLDRKSTRLNSSHVSESRMPSSA